MQPQVDLFLIGIKYELKLFSKLIIKILFCGLTHQIEESVQPEQISILIG